MGNMNINKSIGELYYEQYNVLVSAVEGSKVKVNVTMNNGITYNCYVVDYIDSNSVRVSRNYEDELGNVIDANYVGHVVIRTNH